MMKHRYLYMLLSILTMGIVTCALGIIVYLMSTIAGYLVGLFGWLQATAIVASVVVVGLSAMFGYARGIQEERNLRHG